MSYEFPQTPPPDYFCPVSMELLVAANQTTCCGSHISEDIASNLEQEDKPCPLCNKRRMKTTKDLYFRRLVSQVKIYCTKRALGCKWEGEAGGLAKHLGWGAVDAGDCKYVEVPCPYLCFHHIMRFKLQHHMKEECPKRPYSCNYCNYEASHNVIVNEHLLVCDKFPTRCPNKCDDLLCRSEVKQHVDTACPLQKVRCEFEYAGCTNVKRKDYQKHMEQSMQAHLDMVARHSQKKDQEVRALIAQVHQLTNLVAKYHKRPFEAVTTEYKNLGFIQPPTMTLNNFRKLHEKKEYWRSADFYSRAGGYKMCLVVFPGSETDQEGKEYLGVYLQMVAGEYDDQLKWPFYGKVDICMLNQESDTGHIERTLLDASSYSKEGFHLKMVDRVHGNNTPSVWGCSTFAPLKSLRLNKSTNTQYLKDDCLKFQVLNVEQSECTSGT